MKIKNIHEINKLEQQICTRTRGNESPQTKPQMRIGKFAFCCICNLPIKHCFNISHTKYNSYIPEDIFKMQVGIDSLVGLFSNSSFCELSHPLGMTVGDTDWIIALFEDILLCMTMVFRAQSRVDVVLSITSFARCRFGPNKSLLQSFIKNFSTLWEKDSDYFVPQSSSQFDFSQIDSVRDIILNYGKFKESPFFKKIYKLLIYCMSFNLFTNFGLTFDLFNYKTCEQEALRLANSSKLGFLEQLIDTITFLAQKGYQIYKSGSIDPIFHTGERYAEWFEAASWLKDNHGKLDDCESFGFSFSEYYDKLHNIVEQGEAIYKHAVDISTWDKKVVFSLLSQLKTLKCEIETMTNARKSRLTPFSFVIYGDTGIGKSTLVEFLFAYYGKLRNLPVEPKFKYTRNPNANFWDGYLPSQWCCLLDDIGFREPRSAAAGDPTVLEFLQIINQIPFCPDQADLLRKGRTPFRSEFVMATTNVKDLNAYHYYSQPSAAQRRFPYVITPKVKEEFKTNNMLDSTKTYTDSDGLPDFWTFTVERVIPAPPGQQKSKAGYQQVLVDCDLTEFLEFFSEIVDQHWSNQTKVADSVSVIQTMDLCSCCNLPNSRCKQLTPQVYVETVSTISLLTIWAFLCLFFFKLGILFDVIRKWERISLWSSSWWYRIMHPYDSYINSRSYWEGLGTRVQNTFQTPGFLLRISLVASTAYLFAKLISLFNVDDVLSPQRLESNVDFRVPCPKEKERVNVWYNKDIDLVPTYVSDASSALFGKITDLQQKVARNTIVCILDVDKKRYRCRMLCIKDNLFIVNNHCIPEEDAVLHIVQSKSAQGVNRNLITTLNLSSVYRDEKNDLAIIKIGCLPPRKSLVKYLLPRAYTTLMKGIYIGMSSEGVLEENSVKAVRDGGLHSTKGIVCDTWLGETTIKTSEGYCGTPLVVDTPRGPAIAGIHSLGTEFSNIVCATKLPLEYITSALKHFETVDIAPISISSESVKRELKTLHDKSPFRFIEEGTANVIGSFDGYRPRPKTTVCKTLLHDQLKVEGYREKYAKPVMGGWIPWRLAALDLTNPVLMMDQDIISTVTEGFIKDILNELPQTEMSHLHKYDMFTAINGTAGVSYVDSINRNTSIGLPYRRPKKDFLEPVPETEGLTDPVKFSPEIERRIERIMELYNSGKRAYPIYNACLKDEPVTIKKHKSGKTRVFSSAPADFSIVVRMYLLSFVRVVQNNKFIFESCPGTICQSSEWGQLYDHLTSHGTDRIIAGDFKAFDKRMCAQIIDAAFDVIVAVLKASGNYTKEDILVIRCIAADVKFPLTDFNGDLVEFYGSNPSGWPLTVILNGLVNSLYMRYVYALANPERSVDDFKKDVHLLTYGDDNIMGVNPECNFFNHTVIQDELAKVGIIYTMPDKEKESQPFIDISESSFLKRSWRFDESVGDFFCPLEHDSIEKMLMTWVRSKTIIPEVQMCCILDSALQEYFFYGEERFAQARSLFVSLVERNSLESYMSRPFPTFIDLVERWNDASRSLEDRQIEDLPQIIDTHL